MTRHLAHFNLARLRHDRDDPRSAEFMDNIPKIAAIAVASPGFVKELDLGSDHGNAYDPASIFGPDTRLIMTLSVWENADALRTFVYKSAHGPFVQRRNTWFEPLETPAYVLWDIEAGHLPTLIDAKARLEQLHRDGPSDKVYDFRYLKMMNPTAPS